MIQYGMPTLIENRTLQENIDLCIRLGLRFIELNMNFPEYQVDRLEESDLFLDAADAAGIYYTIHLDENLNIADFNRLVTDAYLETVRRTIEVAKQLLPLRDKYGDASQPLTINMHMHHGIFITLPDRKVQMYDRDKDRYLEDCRRFRDLCGSWIGARASALPGTSAIPKRLAKRMYPSSWPVRTGWSISISMTAQNSRPATIWRWATGKSTWLTGWHWRKAAVAGACWKPRRSKP